MRGLRRILGAPRFSESNDYTDRQVREQLGQPSLDCIISRARLIYAARICRDRPLALIGLLHTRVGPTKSRLPWVTLLGQDVEALRRSLLLDETWPGFFDDDVFWFNQMLSLGPWRSMADRFLF